MSQSTADAATTAASPPSKRSAIRTVLVVILAIIAAVGAWGIGQRLSTGMAVTNLTSTMTWGLWVAFYIYFIGLSAGSFLMSTLVYVFGQTRFEKIGKIALLSALFALVAGMSFIWLDLGHPFRFYKIATGWQVSSVLSWESMFYGFYIAACSAELWLLMRCDLATLGAQGKGLKSGIARVLALGWTCPSTPQEEARCHAQSLKWVRIIGTAGVPVAIGVHGGTGSIFAVVAAKPYWFSGLFPIIFLVSALVSGCGMMIMLYGAFGRRDDDYRGVMAGLRDYLLLFIGVDLLLFISDLLVSLYAGIPEHVDVWRMIMFGPYWYVFWIGQIGLAWTLPLVLSSLPSTRNHPKWLVFAGASVVVGIISVRLNLVIPAYIIPVLKGLDTAFYAPRLAYEYFPSFLEWLSSAGIFAIVTLGFWFAWSVLPVQGLTEEKES